jgi:hypothetical protein
MKKYILLLLLLAGLSGFAFIKAYRPTLQYDGIYVNKLDAENSAIIRFYEDGVVIVSSSVNDYSKVMTWFNRDKENFSRVLTGKYKMGKRDASLRFRVKGETGEQKYSGFITADKTLELHIFNPKDQTSTDRIYTFVKPN